MDLATVVLPRVVAKLGDLLVGEYNLQKRVKGEIRFLQSELESMQGALEKISNTPANELDIQDKIWARDLRELSYDIEDSIDTFIVRGVNSVSAELFGIRKFIHRSVGLFRKAKIRHGIAIEIIGIKSRVVEVHKRHRRYKMNPSADNKHVTTLVDPRLFNQYIDMKEFVGIDETRDELIKILAQKNQVSMEQGKIVSIVGFGGLGKTTLANAVYKKIRPMFDCCAFVSVSQSPDLMKLFKGILYQLDGEYKSINEKPWDEGELANELRKFLQQKRYFIVIDDLWNISIWKMIRCALPDNDVGYIIITTTRISDVAEKVGGAYKLKPLSSNNSRKLLYRRIFGNENKDICEDTAKCPDEELAEVSDRILNKCAGVPLAIITLASLLSCKAKNKMDWFEVYNSVGTGLENNLDVENMRKILSFSYFDLPSHLKTCLLYLAVFPKDYEIEKDRLIWMWIAEGFVKCEKQGSSPFELGESYLNDLINKSMIQPICDDMVHVHDMVLDLICSLSVEENFVTIVKGIDHRPTSYTIRRLSLQDGTQNHAMTSVNRSLQQVRSVVVAFPSSVNLVPVLRNFQVLRVLNLEGCDLSQQDYSLKYLKNLFHLRYLGLGGTHIQQVPEEIGNIQFLQTLDVGRTSISDLPSTIVQLKHLKCLRFPLFTTVPNAIGSLTSLNYLEGVVIGKCDVGIVEELGKLTELVVLYIGFRRTWGGSIVYRRCKISNVYTSVARMVIGERMDWMPGSPLVICVNWM